MNMSKKQARELVSVLRDVRQHTTMQHMSVGNGAFVHDKTLKFPDGRLVNEDNLDEFIRERTRIFRESWIIPFLDEVIVELRKFA